jgi:hypothetical protein
MVFFGSGQIDDDGLRVKELIERELSAMDKPAADFLTIVQGGSDDHSDPVATIRTRHGLRTMRVARILIYEQSEAWLSQQIRIRLEAMYRQPTFAA